MGKSKQTTYTGHTRRAASLREAEPQILAALGGSLEPWAKQCHAASIAIVRARVFPQARVARGYCKHVSGQHSWVVVGHDCYDPDAQIVDPTMWCHTATTLAMPIIWYGSAREGMHTPHGAGNIWKWGRPAEPKGLPIGLTPKTPLSPAARVFLGALGPLDYDGWRVLASSAPVEGWPAGEILSAIADTAALDMLVPIDRLGMLTDRNPCGLYLAGALEDP